MTRDGAWRRARLADSVLYLCTDARVAPGDLEGFLDIVLSAGVDIVQLRDKQADEATLRRAAAVFRECARRHDALFVLNDLPALAAEIDADGVHVGQDDDPPAVARSAVGPERLVGRSTHGPDQTDAALTEDCDYFAVGPVEPTPTKHGRPGIGLDPLRHAAATGTERPWFVTGGMAPRTVPAVLEAGARRVVVVRAITEAPRPAEVVAELVALLRPATV